MFISIQIIIYIKMRYTSNKSKKRVINAKKSTIDGIKFASSLEAYMYTSLKDAGIKAEYEGEQFILIDSFEFDIDCYERTTRREFKNRGRNKILPIKYTPDFVGDGFIIECKGRALKDFPLRWKLFKKWLVENRPNTLLFKPQNKKDCDEVIEILQNNLRN